MTAQRLHIALCAPLASEDVLDLLPPAAGLPAGYGGAPFVATLARAFLDQGHRVSVISTAASLPSDRETPLMAQQGAFSVHYVAARRHAWRFNGRHPGRALDAFALERRRLTAALQSLNPDIVHAHWSYEFALAAIASGLPRLVTCHDDPAVVMRFMPGLYRGVRWLMAARVFRTPGRFTTVSPYMQQRLRSRVNGPLALVANPLPPALLGAAAGAAPAAQAQGVLRVAMVNNGWGRRKNPETALRAHALVRRSLPDARLTCYGTDYGPGQPAQQWALAQGLADGVDFVGRLPATALYEQLRAHQVLVHTALEESFGMVLAEAMALGLAVVAGRDSAAVPWVLGPAGVLVDVRDPTAVAGAVLNLASDIARRTALVEQGRTAVAQRFGAPAVAAAYLHEYGNCIAEWAPTGAVGKLESAS